MTLALYIAVLIGIAAVLWGFHWLLSLYARSVEHDDDVARAASGMDDFGAPEANP